LILTANGERPFNDLIGTPIKRLLFDNSNGDTLKIILKQMITQVVSNFEPRATLT
jgi:phage baseplate assembly protein W